MSRLQIWIALLGIILIFCGCVTYYISMDYFHLVASSIRSEESTRKQLEKQSTNQLPTFIKPPPLPKPSSPVISPAATDEKKIDDETVSSSPPLTMVVATKPLLNNSKLERLSNEKAFDYGVRQIETVIKTIQLPCSCSDVRKICDAYRQIRHSCDVGRLELLKIFKRSIPGDKQSQFIAQFMKCIKNKANFYFVDADPSIVKLH